MSFYLFLLGLILLFISSKVVINVLYQLLFNITKNRNASIYLLAILFFPGTVVHEFAHLFTALFLRVATGTIELFPKINETGVRLGSVQIAQTDPFRRFAIGAAPVFVGALAIFWVLQYVHIFYITYYLLFVIANTMFSSKRDMEGAVPVVGAFLFVGAALFIAGVRVPTEIVDHVVVLTQQGLWILVFPLGINAVMYALGKAALYRR